MRVRAALAAIFSVVDRFTVALCVTVLAGSLLPCTGGAALLLDRATNVAVAALFFLHGAKLSSAAVRAGAVHWRLHLVVMLSTFCMFPLLGLALRPLLAPLVTPQLYVGILFVCALPSTVQSSIAFVSIARGNVPAAVCSATASSLAGIFLTPLLVGLLVAQRDAGVVPWQAIGHIGTQLLAPFIAGQIARRWIGGWIAAHPAGIKLVDQGSILMVVYGAFGEAVREGLWQQIPLRSLAGLTVVCVVLLAAALLTTRLAARTLGFNREDEIAILFCGSKKSLASGAPMAKVLFSAAGVGAMVLPLMLFHQIQLMVCAVIARRYALDPEEP